MNAPTITMTKEAATAAFREYQAAVRADRGTTRKVWREEDLALMQAYKHLARGEAVLDLPAAMTHAGAKPFETCPIPLPVLAVAPSDAEKCYLRLKDDGGAMFSGSELNHWRPPIKSRTMQFPPDTYPRHSGSEFWKHCFHSTLVPLIPPHLRPKFTLANYWTLWEVESWTAEPPKDPMLLKRLGNGLFAVLATWDLTDIERAVLRRHA